MTILEKFPQSNTVLAPWQLEKNPKSLGVNTVEKLSKVCRLGKSNFVFPPYLPNDICCANGHWLLNMMAKFFPLWMQTFELLLFQSDPFVVWHCDSFFSVLWIKSCDHCQKCTVVVIKGNWIQRLLKITLNKNRKSFWSFLFGPMKGSGGPKKNNNK